MTTGTSRNPFPQHADFILLGVTLIQKTMICTSIITGQTKL